MISILKALCKAYNVRNQVAKKKIDKYSVEET